MLHLAIRVLDISHQKFHWQRLLLGKNHTYLLVVRQLEVQHITHADRNCHLSELRRRALLSHLVTLPTFNRSLLNKGWSRQCEMCHFCIELKLLCDGIYRCCQWNICLQRWKCFLSVMDIDLGGKSMQWDPGLPGRCRRVRGIMRYASVPLCAVIGLCVIDVGAHVCNKTSAECQPTVGKALSVCLSVCPTIFLCVRSTGMSDLWLSLHAILFRASWC